MSEQEEKVLYYCREWYRTGREVIKQTLWYEIGVMLENEPDAEQSVQSDLGWKCAVCESTNLASDLECGYCDTPRPSR